MPRQCTICTHKQRESIDTDLLRGASLRDIAGRTGTSKSALERHKADHMPSSLLAAQQVELAARADTLLEQIRGYQDHVDRLTIKAEQAGDFRTAFTGLREARGYIELLAKLMGELDERPQVNVHFDNRVQQLILDALEPYAEAKYAVAAALEEVES